jgi:diadenosine tetraphosphate (Ap4A) HIT family hydrolase/HKD family nuclease
MSHCPFCKRDDRELVYENELVFAVRDLFPVSEGHTLIIPNRHVESYFDATPLEKQAIWEAVEHVKIGLDEALAPQGYNVGFNSGQVAGQTVMHLHVHVIPRYVGDTPDPRGGVRGVIPSKQKYDPAEGTDGPPTSTADDPFASLADFVPGEDFPFLQVLQAALRVSHHTDIVSAFVQKSGVDELEGPLTDALDRGAKIRILTGDYLGITNPHALQRLYTLATQYEHLQARLFRVEGKQAFHPKAYIFSAGAHGAAFVGSSNVSRSALTDGIEWNLKSTSGEPGAFKAIQERFASLFDSPQAKPLSPELLKDYQSVVRVPPQPEPAALLPTPHPIQAEVLEKLRKTRDEGARRGLVVMATGLGKTFLSAFDAKQTGAQRVLFVAHRQEILEQAATTWSRVFPDRTIGFLIGGQHEPDAQMVFASVQTLSKVRHLRRFAPTHFDYIVIDEFHHAAAASYRKLLGHFTPRFLLGLTATPDRMEDRKSVV